MQMNKDRRVADSAQEAYVINCLIATCNVTGIEVFSQGFDTEEELIEAFHQTEVLSKQGCRTGVVFTDIDNVTHTYAYDLRFEATPGGYQKNTHSKNKEDLPPGGLQALLPGMTWLTNKARPVFQSLGARNDVEVCVHTMSVFQTRVTGFVKRDIVQ